MNAPVRALLTIITVAALSILVLTAPAVAGVPAHGEQPPHHATTEHPTLAQSGRGAQFDRDESAPVTGSQRASRGGAMSLRRFGVLVVAVVAGLAVGVPPTFAAESSGEDGRIAFASDRRDGDDEDIWLMRPDGSRPVNLTADSDGSDFGPSWRPDGRKIAFVSNRVTATNPEEDFEVFVMNADGSGVQQLTINAFDDEFLSWSPDGRQLVVQRDLDPVVGQVDYDLFTMRADGTSQRNLTRSPGIQDEHADWSPNGRRIAFMSDRDGDTEVYTIRLDGSGESQLTVNDGPFDGFPAWSPDGRRIAFASNFQIFTMRADGSNPTRLTFNDSLDALPAWSPDGRRIAFVSIRDGNDEVYTMRAEGSQQVNRTQNPAFDVDPDWQPLPKHHH